MLETSPPVIPPAPVVHARELSTFRLALTAVRNSLEIWPESAFDLRFSRNRVLGVENVLISDPEGIRHVLAANATNYVRPTIMPRLLRPLVGEGVFLAEGTAWRRQRRQLASVFTPASVSTLLPHFRLAAQDFAEEIRSGEAVNLCDAYQSVALNAVLRALFSLPAQHYRDRVGGVVRHYVDGPGRPQIFDGIAKDESSFAFALGGRRAFQRRWTALVDTLVMERRAKPVPPASQDMLDLLLAVRDPDTAEPLALEQIRDQAATMIFAGYETTARTLFWATYLLTLDTAEQARVRAEVRAFPAEKATKLADLDNWPRLRNVLLEALRLYPPVPMLVREPIHEDSIMGEPVRPGVQVYIAPWVLHRHRAYWDEPTAFRPDRFSGQTAPWTAGGAYLPFGAGPRICIGAVFALAEAQIVLATLLAGHRVSIEDPRPVLPIGRLTTQPSYRPNFLLEAEMR